MYLNDFWLLEFAKQTIEKRFNHSWNDVVYIRLESDTFPGLLR
jgi:hypothetical protein